MRNQRTIKSSVSLSGIGLHSGEDVNLSLLPAEADQGVRFIRIDLPDRPVIPFDFDHLARHDRQTTVANGSAEVNTVEHLGAGLLALGIDNCTVEIDGPEVPGMDGSSLPFVEALRKAGRSELKAPRRAFTVDEVVAVHDDEASIVAFPADQGLEVTYTLSYPPETGLSPQHVTLTINEDCFVSEIAPARTFCLESEARALQAAGYGKGANTSNTLVIGREGLVDNEFRLGDELARHKVLDLIGDLSLLGADLKARVVATCSGHGTNHALVRKLRSRMRDLEGRGLLQRDTGLDVREILKIIPHRYPFLFVDRVVELQGYKRAVGLKNVSFNEPYFQGHWPGQPIMPGVLQVEALAQLSGVLLLRRLQNTGKVAVLLAIDHIKFRRAVVPGDQLRLECDTIFLKSRSGKVRGRAFVNDDLTCEAVMKFMLMDA